MSRTDSIGDVVLTLPMAGFIKKQNAQHKVIFLGRTYTKDIIVLSKHVDEFINYDEVEKLSSAEQKQFFSKYKIDYFIHVFPNKHIANLAKLIGVKRRLGTTNRLFHWFSCNHLVPLSRKKSNLHEAQLNLKLLTFLKVDLNVALDEISSLYGFENVPNLQFDTLNLLDNKRKKVILHPKSKGSAKEWGLSNFSDLIKLLPKDKYQLFISGTKQDADQMRDFLNANTDAIDVTGKMSLQEFIVFINHCDALVAASTGPLHIAAALNKVSIGLFTSKRPMHPGRWAPIGNFAQALVFDVHCENCKSGKDCNCIKKLSAGQVANLL